MPQRVRWFFIIKVGQLWIGSINLLVILLVITGGGQYWGALLHIYLFRRAASVPPTPVSLSEGCVALGARGFASRHPRNGLKCHLQKQPLEHL